MIWKHSKCPKVVTLAAKRQRQQSSIGVKMQSGGGSNRGSRIEQQMRRNQGSGAKGVRVFLSLGTSVVMVETENIQRQRRDGGSKETQAAARNTDVMVKIATMK